MQEPSAGDDHRQVCWHTSSLARNRATRLRYAQSVFKREADSTLLLGGENDECASSWFSAKHLGDALYQQLPRRTGGDGSTARWTYAECRRRRQRVVRRHGVYVP